MICHYTLIHSQIQLNTDCKKTVLTPIKNNDIRSPCALRKLSEYYDIIFHVSIVNGQTKGTIMDQTSFKYLLSLTVFLSAGSNAEILEKGNNNVLLSKQQIIHGQTFIFEKIRDKRQKWRNKRTNF